MKPIPHDCSTAPRQSRRPIVRLMMATVVLFSVANFTHAQGKKQNARREISHDILTETEWQAVESAVDRGLAFLSDQRRPDGSYQSNTSSEPGITGLCVLAFLSRGHVPELGPYGSQLSKSIDYIIDSQQADGMLSRNRQSQPAHYNHGIGSLVLSEVYGITRPANEERFREAIERAIKYTSRRNPAPKSRADDQGSWRYLQHRGTSSGDLSITSWSVMSLRSAKNAGFDVDPRLIEDALAYMRRLYDPQHKTFRYEIHAEDPPNNYPRGMAGAGVLSFSLAGEHQSELAKSAANYILKRPFSQYERPISGEEYPCYGAFYCSQGMFHMGGEYWSKYYPTLVKTLLNAQRADGSWVMQQGMDARYGASYMTAITILALTPPYQMLPIFQR